MNDERPSVLTNILVPKEPFDEPADDFGLEVARGLIPEASCFHSLGERSAVAVVPQGADLWLGTANQLPVPPSLGEQMEIVSDAVTDSAAGIGIQRVAIHYLDAQGDQQTELLTMHATDGTVPVVTIATDMRFINEFHAVRVGSNGVAAGNISIRTAGGGSPYNHIALGGNMAVTISRMIPRNHAFYLKGWTATSTVPNKQVTIRIRATQHHGAVLPGVFLFLDTAVLEVSSYTSKWACPPKIPAFTIIKVSAWAAQAGANISASFDGFLYRV